ncbi:tetratricopeptide repeat protein [Campylobacter sp. RM9344]|uniref:Tetratricopeptide repeat protein n=1 Tax=Campylobacter californiensis TaxID=1032243 RepID=A0AAW3ZUJ6_9BACT|nr:MULTISPECIES: tetratricopeptide repeat protein [unclassified Campylobacter]MBE2984403.1 tetratricopeptide repeat protein [Campylobacter sp. RM6883]MBE2985741.1 tetratricopeptide repeat protein [Campylobacter sp. RM12919]MBE2988739.1 tetratricopeptide repeat protein [Campylobacter sp. RM12920]MBE2995838.1 tetratricopeptide repeat protein [Campylobacter sp. RM6913]MBE3029669.1 tetratricopeptide repeat protein [Campylobacter sp. RM9344]
MNQKILLLAALNFWVAISLFAEVSAFDAGNINTASPYGLTDGEKAALSNRRSVQNIEENMNSVSEQLQGLQSLIESMSLRMNKLEQRVDDLETRVNGDVNNSGNSLASLKAYVEETRKIQDRNYKNITDTLNKLSGLIDKKNTNTSNSQKASDQNQNKTKSNFSGKNDKDVMSDGIKLLNSNKTSEAAEYFEYLLKKNYKPSTSNFYLGEVAYKQKSYSTAIKYYQKSIEANDKADYTPKLLYHTAISFDKIGDTQSANRFYKALKVGYPDSKEAKASPDRN